MHFIRQSFIKVEKGEKAVSDSKKPKPLPPDDFGATTPNIKIPKSDTPSYNPPSSDWEKTNYNYSPKDLGREEWNKTAFNIPKSSPPQPSQKEGEWGMTQAQINLPNNQSNQYQQSFDDDFGEKRSDYDKTSVGINLPRNEPPKYQEPPSDKKEEEKIEQEKRGGIPGWIWASAGLLGMFLFAVAVLIVVYFVFLGKTGFEVVIKGAPVRSDVMVNGAFWGVTGVDGSIRLQSLRAGEMKAIEIKTPTSNCSVKPIETDEAKDGRVIERPASCTNTGGNQTPPVQQTAPPECLNISDFETSRRCAYTELDKLEKAGTWTVDQLLYAMNLYIINFDRKKWDIKPIDMKFVERASTFIKKLPPNTIIEVGGHTDSDGSDQDNQKLSENRANSVMTELVKFGVTQTMLKSQGYGEKRPKPGNTNANDIEKFRNRRIEYTVLSK